MEAIAGAEAPFVSRGDDSGTHQLELQLWEEAGIQPAGDWYQESGQGMGQTIQIASEQGAYTIADRGTYLATEDGNDLEVLFEGDPALLNVYHVIPITKAAGERVNEEGGAAFAEWLVSPEVQDLIADFGVAEFGRPLFVPDAGKSEAEVAQAA
jgi:tungstate transport system substrate-binding protein